MKSSRRQFVNLAACAAALPALSKSAPAQAYPSRPITREARWLHDHYRLPRLTCGERRLLFAALRCDQ
jgi:hypothetical protein